MRHVGPITVVALTAALAFALVGCANNANSSSGSSEPQLEITDGTITESGVVVTLENASATPTSDVNGYDYSFDVSIENTSDEGVMQVVYGIATYDADGNEIRSFGRVHDEEVRALAPGEKASDHIDSRWGAAEPASVSLTGLTVIPESEMPAIHLPQKGEYLYQALGDEKLANMKEEPPVSLTFHIDQGGAGRTATFRSGDSLTKAVDLLCNVTIGDDNAESATDNYNGIYLTWADGSRSSINLTLRNLEYSGHKNQYHVYTLENLDPFWNYVANSATPDDDAEMQDS